MFAMCEQDNMTIAELRAELGLSLQAFADMLGLQSKSYAHDIERSNRCSVKMALELERLSGGRIVAATLNTDIGLVEMARGIAA